jgi:hypothetical protein
MKMTPNVESTQTLRITIHFVANCYPEHQQQFMDLMKFINIKISPEMRNQLSILQESSKSANKFVPSNVLIVYCILERWPRNGNFLISDSSLKTTALLLLLRTLFLVVDQSVARATCRRPHKRHALILSFDTLEKKCFDFVSAVCEPASTIKTRSKIESRI